MRRLRKCLLHSPQRVILDTKPLSFLRVPEGQVTGTSVLNKQAGSFCETNYCALWAEVGSVSGQTPIWSLVLTESLSDDCSLKNQSTWPLTIKLFSLLLRNCSFGTVK